MQKNLSIKEFPHFVFSNFKLGFKIFNRQPFHLIHNFAIMFTKPNIHAAFLKALNNQIEQLNGTLNDLKYSASNETKSTAGDKHETALAHLQIQQNQTRMQLSKLEVNKAALMKINPENEHSEVRLGSLIHTNQGVFFMSIAMQALEIDGVKIVAISVASPLGSKMIGKTLGDVVSFNEKNFVLELLK